MSLRLQEKLLRVIEYGEFERLGGHKTLQVDVRIVAATNANLPALAKANQFREDLLDRLAFDVIHVPPLRERKEDIAELMDYFAVKMSHELGWEYYSGFSSRAKNELLAHSWPGNIRELKNVVERSLYRWGSGETPIDNVIIDPFISPLNAINNSTTQTPNHAAINQSPAELKPTEGASFSEKTKAYELTLINEALIKNNHHQKNTADYLGLTYHQFRALMRKYKA